MKTPALALAVCPECSNLLKLEYPRWHFASNTSEKRKRKCYIWVGCKHAQPLSSMLTIVDDSAEWERIEKAWEAQAESMLNEKVKDWKPAVALAYRNAMKERAFLPGVTAELPFEMPKVRKPYADDSDSPY